MRSTISTNPVGMTRAPKGMLAGLVLASALMACSEPEPADPHLRKYIKAVVRDKQSKLPVYLGDGFAVDTVGTRGNVILYGVQGDRPSTSYSKAERATLGKQFEKGVPGLLCSDENTRRFLSAGGQIHWAVLSSDGQLLAGFKLAGCA